MGMIYVPGDSFCAANSIILHFFILSTLSWMLAQGVALYRALVIVITFQEGCWSYILCSWVFPGLVVSLCSLLSYDSYTTDETCWIDMNSPLAVAVGLPLSTVVLCNIVICALIVRSTRHTKALSINAVIAVLALLGLAWVFAALS